MKIDYRVCVEAGHQPVEKFYDIQVEDRGLALVSVEIAEASRLAELQAIQEFETGSARTVLIYRIGPEHTVNYSQYI